MKHTLRMFTTFATTLVFALACLPGLAHGQERGTAKATIGNAHVSIEYGRPELKGRDMLSKMQAGAIWRLGANEATTLTSDADLDFAGTRLPKGKYILLAQLAEGGKWSLIASSKGAMQFEDSAKLAEIPLTFSNAKDSVEELKITLAAQGAKGTIEIAWGTSRLTGSFACAK